MCFETTKTTKAKIAEKDIVCYKFLSLNKGPFFTGNHNITTPYKKGKLNPVVKLRKRQPGVIEIMYYEKEIPEDAMFIHKGYHSYKSEIGMQLAKNKWFPYTSREAKFIIPAGTRYYENDTEYVSETIMMV